MLERNILKAEKFIKVGKFHDALELYNNILKKYPKNKRALLGKLSCKEYAPEKFIDNIIYLFQSGLFENAEQKLNEIILKYPEDENLYNIAGAIYSRQKKFEIAIENYKKAIALKNDFPEAYNNLAETYNTLKRFHESVEICQFLIKDYPNYAEPYNNLGNSLIGLGRFKEALRYFEGSKHLNNPNKSSVLNNIALANAYLGNFSKTIDCAFEAFRINIKNEEIINSLSSLILYSNPEDNEKIDEFLKSNYEYFSKKSKIFVLTYRLINYFCQMKFDLCLNLISEIKKYLILQKTEKIITDDKVERFISAYLSFIEKLIQYKNINTTHNAINNINEKQLYHVGESHCLTFAHENIRIKNNIFKIKPIITTGVKAFHLSQQKDNKFKLFFNHQINKIPQNSKVFISIGEIDCRENEGIISHFLKNKKDLELIIEKTVNGYVNHVEEVFKNKNIEIYYFSVPAPLRNLSVIERALFDLRIKVVKLFNENLKKNVLRFNSNYIDTYNFTSTHNGISNDLYMIDNFHLSPKALKIIEKNI